MNIAIIKAIDWAQYNQQMDINEEFILSEGLIVGFLVKEDKKKIVLAHQHFPRAYSSDDVRYTSVIPKRNIIKRKDIEIHTI